MDERFDASKVQWDDEDQADAAATSESSEFADMMAGQAVDAIEQDLRVGLKVAGTIAEIRTAGEVLVDLGGKSTGMLPADELPEDAKVGDEIEAVVVEVSGNEAQLSIKRAAELRSAEGLREAMQAKLAVRGKVTGANKGGFEVKIGATRAFCPVSQMDAQFIHDKSKYMNRDFDFIIQKMSGRDVVVSRRAALEQEQEREIQKLVENFDEVKDKILTGKVVEIRDFGAFVEVAGLTGMVHISELSHARVSRVADAVKVGETVRVKILKIEGEGRRRKVSMTMKGADQDPWDQVGDLVKEGESRKGQVVRLADFGAFVELSPGLDGVVHVSEMSWTKRVKHPSEVLQPGQVVDVRVLDVDSARRRISLTMKSIEDDPWYAVKEDLPVGKSVQGTVERLKNFGAIVELQPGLTALLPISVLKTAFGESYKKKAQPGTQLDLEIAEVDLNQKKIRVNIPGVESDDDGTADFREYQQQQETQPKEEKSLGSFGELLQASLKKK